MSHRHVWLAILLLASAPALATPPGPTEPSLQASGQITSNTYGASVNLLTATSLYPNPTITGFSISTPANLAGCTAQQPQISLHSPSGVQLSLTTLTNGLSQWTNSTGLPHTLSLGDSVLAVLITPGDSGCTNDLPITVTLTYLPGPPATVPGNLVTSGQITTNTPGTSINLYAPSYLYPNATLTALSISTPGTLSACSTQPQVTFYVGTSPVNTTTLGNGVSSWTPTAGLPYAIGPTNTVTAVLSQAGIGCSSELPITVTATINLGAVGLVPVSFNVSDIGGSPGTTVKARFTLVNCGSNTPIIGTLNLPQNVKDFTSNSVGLIAGSVYPTDGLRCAGQETTYYQLTYLVNGVPNQITGKYLIQSGPGTFNPALAPLCQSGTYQEFCMLQQTPAGPIIIGPAGPPGPPGAGWNPPIDSGNKILATPADGSSGPMAQRAMAPLDVAPALVSPPPIGNTTPNTVAATSLTYQSVTGVQYLVSKYANFQDAINAAVGSGQVTGVVVDDRTTAYMGAGFNIPDSVTVQLAPVSYTINSTITFNNGYDVVTAGIILQPGGRLLGASTSTNHGTILQPANGLNADLPGTGSMVNIYSKTIPAGTFAIGNGVHCYARMHHTGSATVTMQWALGSNTQNYPTTFSGSTYEVLADIEILTPASLSSELVTLPFTFFGGTTESPQTVTWSDNLANADTIAINFSVASTDHLTGDAFYCQTIQ